MSGLVPSIDTNLEDCPIMDEDDLACCESYIRLYLISKVPSESVPLKSLFTKMKAK